MQPFWRITLLDSLTLTPVRETDGAATERDSTNEIRRFRSQKVASLLAYLALHVGRDCSRDVLCEALWPDGDPHETRNRLRVTLSSLRRQLEPPGVPPGAVLDTSVTNAVRLRAESVWVDVATFETALRTGDTAVARALYKGELLPTFYEEWILMERERLNSLAERLAEGSGSSLSATLARPAVSTAVSEKVTHETPRHVLPHHHLPLYLTRFFGREGERERLRALLSDTQCRLITLTGAGGQGKTRLSVETAREQATRPVWFVALADLWEGGRLADTIRDALALPRSPTPAFGQVVSFLQAQTAPLLVLDNLEQIAPAAAPLLTALLQQVGDLTLLATSRVRLEIPGEQEIPVSPLLIPTQILTPSTDLVAVARHPAVALFVDRAQSARPDFQLTLRNSADIVGICQLLEGIPLGLELAAARSASLTPSQMRQRLTDHWDGLPAVGRTEKTDRHRSLRAAIEWSVALLPLDQRRLFIQLSVFQGGATLPAIEAVCDATYTLDTLTRLRASSLVLLTEDGGGFRYSLLEVLRQWAAEQQSPPEKNALAERHVAWFYRFASDRKTLFSRLSGVAALDEMETEIANFRAALAYCQAENPALSVDLVLALTAFWEHKSHLSEAQNWLEAALPLTSDADENRTAILLALGTTVGRQGDGSAALVWLREAQESHFALPDTMRAALHWATGRAFWVKGALNEALAEFGESRRLYEEQNDPAGLASTLSNIGVARRDLGDYEGAREAFTQAIQCARAHDIPCTLATALDNLASLHHVLGEDGARDLYGESLALKRALGMTDGVAITLSNLATMLCREQDWPEARRLNTEVCALFRETGNRRGLAIALSRMAQIADTEGSHDEAKRHLLESLGLRLALGNPHGIVIALITFSEHAFSMKDMTRAAQILGAAEKLLGERGTLLSPDEDAEYRQHRDAVQALLSPAAFRKAIREGASWTDADLPLKLQK